MPLFTKSPGKKKSLFGPEANKREARRDRLNRLEAQAYRKYAALSAEADRAPQGPKKKALEKRRDKAYQVWNKRKYALINFARKYD